ncbi:unnamed protein product [Amoebophrya sp. A25]|nr:unnamed protein product [Amoebophrya sp. A25]|eukprot:GSA25T00003732001.1
MYNCFLEGGFCSYFYLPMNTIINTLGESIRLFAQNKDQKKMKHPAFRVIACSCIFSPGVAARRFLAATSPTGASQPWGNFVAPSVLQNRRYREAEKIDILDQQEREPHAAHPVSQQEEAEQLQAHAVDDDGEVVESPLKSLKRQDSTTTADEDATRPTNKQDELSTPSSVHQVVSSSSSFSSTGNAASRSDFKSKITSLEDRESPLLDLYVVNAEKDQDEEDLHTIPISVTAALTGETEVFQIDAVEKGTGRVCMIGAQLRQLQHKIEDRFGYPAISQILLDKKDSSQLIASSHFPSRETVVDPAESGAFSEIQNAYFGPLDTPEWATSLIRPASSDDPTTTSGASRISVPDEGEGKKVLFLDRLDANMELIVLRDSSSSHKVQIRVDWEGTVFNLNVWPTMTFQEASQRLVEILVAPRDGPPAADLMRRYHLRVGFMHEQERGHENELAEEIPLDATMEDAGVLPGSTLRASTTLPAKAR